MLLQILPCCSKVELLSFTLLGNKTLGMILSFKTNIFEFDGVNGMCVVFGVASHLVWRTYDLFDKESLFTKFAEVTKIVQKNFNLITN